MSYHIYTTKGITLSYHPWREADRVYNVLTRDLGLVRATALGVRKEASKLRGSLEPLTLSSLSFVRGKEHWRATSSLPIKKIIATPAVLRPLALLERLVQGEAHHPELFDAVEEVLLSPETQDELFEIKFVAKILYHLGYLKEIDLNLGKTELLKAINNGIEASHLMRS